MDSLQDELSKGHTIGIDRDLYKIHDVCGLLKKYIRLLPKPLLLDQLQDLWTETLDFRRDAQRLDGIRLLLLLLPDSNREFFKDLVKMFTTIIMHEKRNLMTAQNLATIFAPILFLSQNVDPEQLRRRTTKLALCLEFIINKGLEVFEPTEKLIQDSLLYLKNCENAMRLKALNNAAMVSTTTLNPSTRFCADAKTPQDYTAMMVSVFFEITVNFGVIWRK